MSAIEISRQLRRRVPRVEPFQQKRDADADENERPDPTRADVDRAHVREQECGATDHKYWGSDTTVKSAILMPVGEATDGHGEKTCSCGRRM